MNKDGDEAEKGEGEGEEEGEEVEEGDVLISNTIKIPIKLYRSLFEYQRTGLTLTLTLTLTL